MNEQQQINILRQTLSTRLGQKAAITIAQISENLGHKSRRQTETFLEIHIQDIGFCVVSSSNGYYRPEIADEINHYHNALRSRIKCIANRIISVRRAALAEGWIRTDKKFTDPTNQPIQQSLPYNDIQTIKTGYNTH